MSLTRPAFPVVLSAPSGAGKTTLAHMMVDRNPDVVFSISATTRAPRPRERDGVDYHFVNDAAFDRMIQRNELAEWAVVHGHRYGTPRREVAEAVERGKTVLLDIDVQGARQVRRLFQNALLIFVLPPTAGELARRLTGRASEDSTARRRRLSNAQRELEAVPEFDFAVVNDDLEQTYSQLECILRAEWTRVDRLPGLRAHGDGLVRELDQLIREL